MPNVIHEVKLDFKDVLLRPKRSSIKSRADVEIRRKFTFLHSKRVHEGVPIIASNMDTVGTFEMAAALAKVCIVCPLLGHCRNLDITTTRHGILFMPVLMSIYINI